MEWQRGTLTPDQLDQVLRFLPVDLSFADENDVLLLLEGRDVQDLRRALHRP